MRLGSLVWDLYSRGILLEPDGNMLAVDPIEKLRPDEVDAIRRHKQEILSLFAAGRFQVALCPGDECDELLLVVDGESYCKRHQMAIRFIESGPH